MTNNPQHQSARLADVLQSLRPRQWVKNIVVLAAFFFAMGDKSQRVTGTDFLTALAAAGLFTLAAGGVYIFNDMRDRKRDRAHPVKCHRPIAAGRITTRLAGILSSIFILIALLTSFIFMPSPFTLALTGYIALQIAYTFFIKHVHLADVFMIAIGFVLRAVAGGLAIDVLISPWLVICTFLMALFLALCKRRHEMQMMEENGGNTATRPHLALNSTRLLDQLIAITAGAVIISYAIYTQWPETVLKFQTHQLYLTIPFVTFGIFRYLDRVYLHNRGDEPEAVLLTDIPLLIDIFLFGMTVLAVTL